MRIIFTIIPVSFLIFLISYSKNNNVQPIQFGSLLIESDPIGADIFLLGTKTSKVTSYEFSCLEYEVYSITLELEPNNATTGFVNVGSSL